MSPELGEAAAGSISSPGTSRAHSCRREQRPRRPGHPVELDAHHSGATSVASSTDGGRRRGEDSILDREVVVQEGNWRGVGAAGRRVDEAAVSSMSLSREDGRDAGWIRWPARKEVPAARGWWVRGGASMGGECGTGIVQEGDWRGGGSAGRRGDEAAAALSGEGGGAELGERCAAMGAE
jgi:hypothetical protein